MTQVVVDNLYIDLFDATNIDIIRYKNRPLVILDLDETLIKAFPNSLEHPCDFMTCNLYIYKRPFLEYFLKTLSIKYDIGIWSAGGSDYVKSIVEYIIPKNVYIRFVYSKNHCVYSDINGCMQLTKPLSKLTNYGYENMLIIDDNADLTVENNKQCIIPTKYNGNSYDCELINILYYLDYISKYQDFKSMPHKDWREIVDLIINEIDLSILEAF